MPQAATKEPLENDPPCPKCGKPMDIRSVTLGGHRIKTTFHCKSCDQTIVIEKINS